MEKADQPIKSSKSILKKWLKQRLIVEKLNNPVGYLLLCFVALVVSYIFGTQGLRTGLIFFAGVILLPTLALSLFHLPFGINLLVLSFFIIIPLKKFIPGIHWELAIDLLAGTLLLGLIVQKVPLKLGRIGPVSFILGVWILYTCLLFLNPFLPKSDFLFFAFRELSVILLLYFLLSRSIQQLQLLQHLTISIILISFLCACYGLYQHFFGLLPHEYRWLYGEESNYALLFDTGKLRVCSILHDPSVFGILMSIMSLFCYVLIVEGRMELKQKVLLALATIPMLCAMVFSGTRTALIIIPVGIFFHTFLSLRKRSIVAASTVGTIGIIFLFLFPGTELNQRIRHTLKGVKANNYEVLIEQHTYIQPFIKNHPFGNGMGKTAYWERRTSELLSQKVLPENGYALVALETGWIGLFIYCSMLFVSLKVGIERYFSQKHSPNRYFYSAYLLVIFGMIVANYSQIVLIQYPMNILFLLGISVITQLPRWEKEALTN
ncbi:MAG: O-antigen ligase family protein [Bacteroidota bacterium]